MHLILSLIDRMSKRGVRPNYPYPFPLFTAADRGSHWAYTRPCQLGVDGIPQCRAVEAVEGIVDHHRHCRGWSRLRVE